MRNAPRRHHRKRQPSAPVTGLRGAASVLAAILFTSAVGISASPAGAATCASLLKLSLPDTTITAAAPYDGVFGKLPAFCRVTATLRPTSDSDINIEVWMPFSAWNGRFLGTGNGGGGGTIRYVTLGHFLPLNYAVANTDQGTSGGNGKALTAHPEQQIDQFTRSTNLMTVRSKQIIEAFYGEHPRYSYFEGCSGGGGQALHEALQFPGDYDGIVAGAPDMNATHRAAGHIWNSLAFDGAANITVAQANAVTAGY